MAAWVKEEEQSSEHRQKKREREDADKVEVAPGVTVASLRRFRAASIGPTQGLPMRRRLWVCACVFFASTDRASTIPSNIRGYQPVTWSAGQENIRSTSSTKL